MHRRIGQYVVYLAVRISICLLQAIRIETAARVADVMARLFCDLLRVRRAVVDENLRHAFPKLSPEQRHTLARQMWRHLFLLVAEVAQAPRKVHETNWRHYIRLRDADRLVRVLLEERPTLVVSAHFGNFELAGYVLGVLGFPTYTVARTLDNPYLDGFVNRFRGATGQHMLPKRGGYDRIVEVLSGGGTLVFLADQYAGSKGCWVEFFDRPASAHKAIALLALTHEAPLAVGSNRRLDRPLRYELAIEGVADPRQDSEILETPARLTQWYTTKLEAAVRRDPTQYWWLHRRWKDRRPIKRSRASLVPTAPTTPSPGR